MKVENDDYVIAKQGAKTALYLVLNGKTGKSVLEETSDLDEPLYVQLDAEDILCNLGPNPEHINKPVMGISVAPFKRMITSAKYGNLYIHREFDKKEQKRLSAALKEVYKQYEDKATVEFLPVEKMKLLPKKGTQAGIYKKKDGKDGRLDEILFFCSFDNPTEAQHLIAHEWAHGLWFRYVSPRLKSQWITLFQKRLHIFDSSPQELADLYNSVSDYSSVTDYIKEMADDTQKEMMKEVIKYWKSYHNLKLDSMDTILQEDRQKFTDYWPAHSTIKKETVDISKYAMKNVEEFFAESFSHWIMGIQIPKDVKKACEVTAKRSRLN